MPMSRMIFVQYATLALSARFLRRATHGLEAQLMQLRPEGRAIALSGAKRTIIPLAHRNEPDGPLNEEDRLRRPLGRRTRRAIAQSGSSATITPRGSATSSWAFVENGLNGQEQRFGM
jgi:hypothetical protein